MEKIYKLKKDLGILCTLISFVATAQVHTTGAGYLLTKEKDTLSIESFTRNSNAVEGRILVRNSVPVKYKFTLSPSKTLTGMEVYLLKSGDEEVWQQAKMVIKGDSIYSLTEKGESKDRDTIKTKKNALAYHPELPMISLLEQIVLRAKEIGDKNVSVPVFLLSTQGKTIDAGVTFSEDNSAEVSLGNMKIDLQLNEKGYIESGTTSNGQTITRLNSVPPSVFKTIAKDYSAPPDAPYTAENVKIKTKAGHILAGTLTIPKSAKGKVPVVVTITGSSPQDRDHSDPVSGKYQFYRRLADSLGREGVAVLRMDDRGIGESTGNFEKATTAERADDIREGVDFLTSRPNIDLDKIFLVGLSEGGLIAPMVAQTHKNVKGIVLMAGPAGNGREMAKYQLENNLSRVDSLSSKEKSNLMEKRMGELEKEAANDPWLKYFLEIEPLNTAKKISNVPVLILHGENDKNVPPDNAKKLADAFRSAGNKDVTVQIFEGLNHVFIKDPDGNPRNYDKLKSFEVAPQVLSTIVGWIDDHVE